MTDVNRILVSMEAFALKISISLPATVTVQATRALYAMSVSIAVIEDLES